MPLSDAQINNGINFMFAEMVDSSVTEIATLILAGQENAAGTFEVFRTSEMRAEEVQFTGFAKEYQFSVFVKTADAKRTSGEAIVEGDKLQMKEGTDGTGETTIFRIHSIKALPARQLLRLDLGDEFEDAG